MQNKYYLLNLKALLPSLQIIQVKTAKSGENESKSNHGMLQSFFAPPTEPSTNGILRILIACQLDSWRCCRFVPSVHACKNILLPCLDTPNKKEQTR